MAAREFDLGDVLTITGNKLVSSRGMHGLRNILEYLVDRPDLPSQMFPTALNLARPWILRRHRQLEGIRIPGWADNRADANRWVKQQKTRLGVNKLAIDPLPPAVWGEAEAKFFAEFKGRIIFESDN